MSIITHDDIHGAQCFFTLHARSGFLQILLDEERSLMTPFSTVFDRYCFMYMPFGAPSAQEVFHKRHHELVGDLPGIEIDTDNILVWGQHSRNIARDSLSSNRELGTVT